MASSGGGGDEVDGCESWPRVEVGGVTKLVM